MKVIITRKLVEEICDRDGGDWIDAVSEMKKGIAEVFMDAVRDGGLNNDPNVKIEFGPDDVRVEVVEEIKNDGKDV